jgi:hypothetical protein
MQGVPTPGPGPRCRETDDHTSCLHHRTGPDGRVQVTVGRIIRTSVPNGTIPAGTSTIPPAQTLDPRCRDVGSGLGSQGGASPYQAGSPDPPLRDFLASRYLRCATSLVQGPPG